MLPQISIRQLHALERRISGSRWYVDEQIWTFLVAALMSESPELYISILCGKRLPLPVAGQVACEAEPLSTRGGTWEGNTVIDIALGHVQVRTLPPQTEKRNTLAGIAYGPHADEVWVCFVEAKNLSDCSYRVTHDPLRNQLTRVIENLLCFQTNGQFPASLHFVLLTPRLFLDNPKSRLCGYKMADYQDRNLILGDITACELNKRASAGYCFPDLRERLQSLAELRWMTFEEVLQHAGLGDNLDVVRRSGELAQTPQLRPPLHQQFLRTFSTR
jgi:hypothetical protein